MLTKKINLVKTLNAKGVSAQYKNEQGENFSLLGGNQDLINDFNITYSLDSNNTVYIFAINDEVIASFELEDEIKENAKELIDYLKDNNIEVVMLTGDNENVAKKVSSILGISKFYAKQTPQSKASFIKELRKEEKIVVMVGDGVNDSVALSNADVAVAMGNSADISLQVSDIVLLNSSLYSLQESFVISKRTYKFIKQNLGISLVYNIVTIPFAMFGYVIPLVAALSMSLSSLLVVLNSLRIKMK